MHPILEQRHIFALRQPPRPATTRDLAWTAGRTCDRILAMLLRWQYCTAAMLSHAYTTLYGAGGSNVRHELARMHRAGLVTRFWQPTEPGTASAPYIYVASAAGGRRVVPPDDWPRLRKPITNRSTRPARTFSHPLGLSLLRMLWEIATDEHEVWRTVHYGTDRAASFTVNVSGQSVRIQPDALILMRNRQHDYHRPVLLEFDSSHKDTTRLHLRALAYHALLGDQAHLVAGHLEERHRVGVGRPLALFVGMTGQHADRLRATAADALGVGTLFARSADFWFSSLDRIVSRDGAILPAPAFLADELAVSLTGKLGRILP